MAALVGSYITHTFKNDTGTAPDGIIIEYDTPVEIVGANGWIPEGKGYGNFSVSGNGTKILDIDRMQTLPKKSLSVRVKASISSRTPDVTKYVWTEKNKPVKSVTRKKATVSPFVISSKSAP